MFFIARGPCYACGKDFDSGEGKAVFVDDGSFLPAFEDFCNECIKNEKRCEKCGTFLIEGREYCSLCDQEKIEEQNEREKAEGEKYAREEANRVRQEYLDTLINTCEQCGEKHKRNASLCEDCAKEYFGW